MESPQALNVPINVKGTEPMKMSAVIGHRGAAQLAPENTLAGIRAAHGCGVSWVEMDVVVLGDGKLVIHHDQSLSRCTDGAGNLLSMGLEQVRTLDAGRHFSSEYMGEKVPTLEEILDLLTELEMGLNLEIKMHDHPVDKLVLPVVETLKRKPCSQGKLVISSFDHNALKLFHQELPDVPIAHLFEKLPENWKEMAGAVGAVSINLGNRSIRRNQVREVLEAGYEVYCYTVNSERRARELWSWGVSGIFTDNPQKIIR